MWSGLKILHHIHVLDFTQEVFTDNDIIVCPFSQFPFGPVDRHMNTTVRCLFQQTLSLNHKPCPNPLGSIFSQFPLVWQANPLVRIRQSNVLLRLSSISTSLILCSFPAHTLLTLMVFEPILRLFLSKFLGSFAWLLSVCWGRTWPGSETARTRAECAWPALSGRESSARSCEQKRQWDRRGRSREWSRSDRLGTAGARTGETWEGRRWDDRQTWHAHATNTWDLSHACVFTCIRVCEVRSERAVRRKMCVQQVGVCTPLRRSHGSCYYVAGRTPTTKKSKNKNHHSMTILREYPQTSFRFFLVSHTGLGPLFCFPPIIRCVS